ncbi:hypothetical protein BpHYR1_052130 [Brachionus plicatilis]|uniref:Uncharacterized protein n=1 Tax=Brachionus plicatilis TaxID=10195 RepID=A0A3M7RX48_BRAPC|nr:hypothetical protein BpHYR1_052130 [Brachionus plicatilis]
MSLVFKYDQSCREPLIGYQAAPLAFANILKVSSSVVGVSCDSPSLLSSKGYLTTKEPLCKLAESTNGCSLDHEIMDSVSG